MSDPAATFFRSHDSRPFWDAIERHRFTVQFCSACSLERWPPVSHCARCGSKQASWRVLPGSGRVEGWAVLHRSSDNRFAPLVPLTIIAARMDGANRRMLFQTYLKEAGAPTRLIGRTVRVAYDRSLVGCMVPVFILAGDHSNPPALSKD